MTNKISALIVVHNEEKILASCLEKLNFANEIVIILDKCNDNSEIIARKYTNEIYKGEWKYEGDRRNFGIDKCNSKWILEVDADEHISKELGLEIIETINNAEYDFSNFHIKVDNYIGEYLVKYGWGGSFGRGGVTCLYKKGTKKWGRQRVHPELTFKGKFGPNLKNHIKHYFVKNISELLKKFDSWTYLKSLDLLDDEKKNTLSHNVRRIISRFLKNYYKRKGYKEGRLGFLIALLAGFFPIVSYLRSEIKKNPKYNTIDK